MGGEGERGKEKGREGGETASERESEREHVGTYGGQQRLLDLMEIE